MKLTFHMISAPNPTLFDVMVNDYFAKGYKFVNGHPITVVPKPNGTDLEYSVAMLLEEEV